MGQTGKEGERKWGGERAKSPPRNAHCGLPYFPRKKRLKAWKKNLLLLPTFLVMAEKKTCDLGGLCNGSENRCSLCWSDERTISTPCFPQSQFFSTNGGLVAGRKTFHFLNETTMNGPKTQTIKGPKKGGEKAFKITLTNDKKGKVGVVKKPKIRNNKPNAGAQ